MVLQDALEEISKAPLSCLEHCVAAGEALEKAVIDSWRDATGIEIKDGTFCGNAALPLPSYIKFSLILVP